MGKGRYFKIFLMLAGIFFAAIAPLSLGAQALDRWLAKPGVLESYGSIEAEITAAAKELEQLSLSEELLISRLEEAAKKNVPASALLTALNDDMEYIRTIVRNFTARNLLPARQKDADKAVQQALLLVRTGIGETEFATALDLASSLEDLNGKQSSIISRAFSALGVTASVHAAYGLSEDSRKTLAAYLITSELAERKFDSVMAQLANRIKNGENVEMAVSSLGKSDNAANGSKKPAQGREKAKDSGNSVDNSYSVPANSGAGQNSGSGAGAEAGQGQSPASSQGNSSSGGAGQGAAPTPGRKKL